MDLKKVVVADVARATCQIFVGGTYVVRLKEGGAASILAFMVAKTTLKDVRNCLPSSYLLPPDTYVLVQLPSRNSKSSCVQVVSFCGSLLRFAAHSESVQFPERHNNNSNVISWALEPEHIRTKYHQWADVERTNHSKTWPEYKFSPAKPKSAKEERSNGTNPQLIDTMAK
jgi:hypothetical protein